MAAAPMQLSSGPNRFDAGITTSYGERGTIGAITFGPAASSPWWNAQKENGNSLLWMISAGVAVLILAWLAFRKRG